MRSAVIAGSTLAPLMVSTEVGLAQATVQNAIKLSESNKTRGLPVMEALSIRASVMEWSERDLSAHDHSDLLYAANGVNRPDKRRTASSAMSAQDVDSYMFREDVVYLYEAVGHALVPVVAGDQRTQIGMAPGGMPGGPGRAGASGAPGAPPVPVARSPRRVQEVT